MAEKKSNEKIRESMLELQMLDAQIRQYEQQLTQLEQQMMEVTETVDQLSGINDIKDGTEILVPVFNGIFAKAKIHDPKKLKVNVGSGVVVEKTVDEAKEMLKEQLANIEKYKNEMFAELEGLISKATMIQRDISGEE